MRRVGDIVVHQLSPNGRHGRQMKVRIVHILVDGQRNVPGTRQECSVRRLAGNAHTCNSQKHGNCLIFPWIPSASNVSLYRRCNRVGGIAGSECWRCPSEGSARCYSSRCRPCTCAAGTGSRLRAGTGRPAPCCARPWSAGRR